MTNKSMEIARVRSNLPAGVILAGGAGRRMGGNKPLYEYEGQALVLWAWSLLGPQVSERFVNAGRTGTPLASALADLNLDLMFDDARYHELGPLSGVHSALQLAKSRGDGLVVTIPCDMPRLPGDLVKTLMSGFGDEADVVYVRGARDYPLCALWRVSLLNALEARLEEAKPKGGLPVMRFLAACRSRSVVITDDSVFLNVNSPIGAPD